MTRVRSVRRCLKSGEGGDVPVLSSAVVVMLNAATLSSGGDIASDATILYSVIECIVVSESG